MPSKKHHSSQITARFLEAMDRIVADRTNGKITAGKFGEAVGISGSNLTRLRTSPDHHVTVEAVGRICAKYKISAAWLITGKGQMFTEAKGDNLEKRVSELEKAVARLKK